MIPWLLKIHIGGSNKKHKRIWIPLPLLYIPLLILIIILAPLLVMGAIFLFLIKRINLFKAIPALFKLLTASRGLLIDVGSQKEKFQIAIK
jgi:hypothetical protein